MKKILLLRNGLITILMALGVFGGNVALAKPFAYVTNHVSNSVSVIDTASNTVVSTIGVGQRPLGVAITPDGSRAYVVNRVSNSVSVIDTTSNTVVASVGVGHEPHSVAITPDGSRAYVGNFSSNSVSVIDTASNTVVSTIGCSSPAGIAITPDGSRAYVANYNPSDVSVIDTTSNAVVTTFGVGDGPQRIAITPDGSRAYVPNSYYRTTVSVIDTASNTVVTTVGGLGQFPTGVAITPDGSRAYVSNAGPSNVSVIDTASNTVVTTVGVGSSPYDVAITSDGSRAYVANTGSNNVSVIDTTSNTVVATVGVGVNPYGVAITPNTKPVAHAGADQAIILLNTEVQLDGTGSYDEDGDAISYDWNITQKPAGSSATLSDSSSATPTVTPDIYGDYLIELTVSDSIATGSTDSVTVGFDNVKPVANAGGNKSILVGETAVQDGTGSTDANGDPLTFSWSLVSKPAGSTATLSGLTSPMTSFVGDISGTYDINLTVNDGLLDSDPNTASILTITVMNAITQVLDDTMVAINNIPPTAFKNPKLANALTNKINAVLKMIEKEKYQGALNKLTNDILTKTDGCANGGEPDKDDWIRTCGEQDAVYSLLMEAISIVKSQI